MAEAESKIVCAMRPCGGEPYCDCRWLVTGPGPQTETFCKKHADELWERINGLVSAGKATYQIGPPGSIRGVAG